MSVAEITTTKQYLTFNLDKELYTVDVSRAQEVLEFKSITRVPQTPEFMRGVINLRGSVVPVVDLRLKFGMSSTESTVDTCIIVVELDLEGENTILGVLADSVQEVIELDPDEIEPPPKIGSSIKTDFIIGMGKRDSQFIIILNFDRVFSIEELESVKAGKEKAPIKN
ncbi:Chemotaxis protein CheW [subsurface metagenome]